MIYTLEWLEQEANLIAGHWNGSDDKFIDGNGDPRSEDDVSAALDLLEKLREIRGLIKELSL